MSHPDGTELNRLLDEYEKRLDPDALISSSGFCSPIVAGGWQERAFEYSRAARAEFLDTTDVIRSLMPTFTVPLRPGQPGYEEQEEHRHWGSILHTAIARLCTCRSCSCGYCPGHTVGCVIHDMDFDDDDG